MPQERPMARTVHRCYKPEGAPPPFSAYSPMVAVDANRRTFQISGQVGVRADGSLPEDGEEQVRLTWLNLLAVLADAELGPEHLVKVVAYITEPGLAGAVRTHRDALLDGAEPASTLVGVPFLAHPDWKVEIEAIAAD
jgi:enamine deaminase RidA (YjgF/YER057c/UK114 family)